MNIDEVVFITDYARDSVCYSAKRELLNKLLSAATCTITSYAFGLRARLIFFGHRKVSYMDLKDNTGSTALILATKKSHKAIARALIEKGAHLPITDNSGRTMLDWASMLRDNKFLKMLYYLMAKVYVKEPALHYGRYLILIDACSSKIMELFCDKKRIRMDRVRVPAHDLAFSLSRVGISRACSVAEMEGDVKSCNSNGCTMLDYWAARRRVCLFLQIHEDR